VVAVPVADELRFVTVDQRDPLAAPLLAELAVEYSQRYGGSEQRVMKWLLEEYPAEDFAPPDGALLVGLLDGVPVTGGAFRRFDDTRAELKRVWTDSRYRQRGFGKAMVAELEREIASRGYRRVYLTTGNRQPEAEALYLSSGYTRLGAPLPTAGETYPVAFEKTLRDQLGL
jgi:ribosomal protein S18 acetylase RimI-like enzyme